MSQVLDEVLSANRIYTDNFGDKGNLTIPPRRRFAILTCMDARLDPAKFAGLSEGDAHVIRNAGGRASDDAIRSLVISYKLLGTREWFVIHHTNCGMETFTDRIMRDLLASSLKTATIDDKGWRSVFLINVPLGIIATVLVAKVVPSSVLSKEKQRFDMVGAILALLTLSSFALGMTQGQREGFNSSHAVSLLALSVIGFVSFLIVETRIKQPLLEIKLFRNLRLSMSLLSNWLVFIVLSGLMLVIPFFLERVKQYPTSKVGLLLAISPIVSGLIAPISGAMSDRFGSRLIGLAGLGLMIGACLAISTFDARITELGYIVPYLIYGTGLGLFRSPNDSTVMGAVSRERLGIASGLLSLSRTCGVTVGIAVIGAIFTGLSGSMDVATATSEAIVAGFQGTFRASAIILSVAALASAFRFHKSNAV